MLEFIQKLNIAVMGKKLGTTNYSSSVDKTLRVLETLNNFVNDYPPLESNQRFGNLAFRDWNQKVQDQALPLTKSLLGDGKYSDEIAVYLAGAFGNAQRIDYGSGHELSFVAWLCCLDLIGFYKGRRGFNLNNLDDDASSLVLGVFQAYLVLVRKLQTIYNLEPAGSHGTFLEFIH